MMIGFAYDPTLIDNHCANHRVGIRLSLSPNRQRKGTFHVETIRLDGGHRLFEEVGDFLRGGDFDVAFFFTEAFFVMVFLAEDFFVAVFFLETFLIALTAVGRFFLVAFPEERCPSSRSSTATAACAAASRAIGTR